MGASFVLSFVVRRDGALLDGTPLGQAIERLDTTAPRPPTGYAINCVYPTVFEATLAILEQYNPALIKRVLSFQAKTSPREPKELDGLGELETEKPEILAGLLLRVHRRYHIPFLGGCCGTDTSHIECLAKLAGT